MQIVRVVQCMGMVQDFALTIGYTIPTPSSYLVLHILALLEPWTTINGTCTVTCGMGVQFKRRTCLLDTDQNQDECLLMDGVTRGLVETTYESCNLGPCDGT